MYEERMNDQESVLMQRLSHLTETFLSKKITRNRIVLSFKDSFRKPLRRRPDKNLMCCSFKRKEREERAEIEGILQIAI